MNKHIIDKSFDFCYGHRVHTQSLNGEYAADLKCACRHLHGHQGKMLLFITSDHLDKTGMVTDFRHTEWLKKWIDKYIDHQFIIDRNDPLYPMLVGDKKLIEINIPDSNQVAGWSIDLSDTEVNTPMYEYLEGLFIVDFVPTSENLSAWMFRIVEAKMSKLGVSIHHIEWWETPKSRSSYYEN